MTTNLSGVGDDDNESESIAEANKRTSEHASHLNDDSNLAVNGTTPSTPERKRQLNETIKSLLRIENCEIDAGTKTTIERNHQVSLND